MISEVASPVSSHRLLQECACLWSFLHRLTFWRDRHILEACHPAHAGLCLGGMLGMTAHRCFDLTSNW